MQIETQREASRPERSPEVFLLSAYTLRDDPEIKRGWEVSSDPPGAFPWPAIWGVTLLVDSRYQEGTTRRDVIETQEVHPGVQG